MNAEIYPLTMVCQNKSCLMRVRIGRILDQPVLEAGAFKYCPKCGSQAAQQKDVDIDYWEIMSNAFEIPIELLKPMYQMWISEPNHQANFRDFVQQLWDEVDDNK